jgi:hypothetical protein
MAKGLEKTAKRIKGERIEKLSHLVRAAMRLGFSTKSDIAEKSGIKIWELNDIFVAHPEIHNEFTIMRRTLVDTAADNLQEILLDKSHPQNFQATKYVLQTYKSDLDSNLITKDKDEVELEIAGSGGVSPVRITFTKPKG